MARVYEARLTGLHGFEKRLAIKMMLPEHAGDTEFVTMLIDEAKIAVALNHSNICQVHELGCIDDRYYIAMEYVEGADLNKVVNQSIRSRIPIPFDVIAQIGQDICAGLDYAHTKVDDKGHPLNIIHRDISPANILLSMSGEVKIVDFGVAKAASRSQHTTVGVVKGKYQYMSPEQVTGRKLDNRSDIFAAGIVMYETVAGRMMYPEGVDMLDRIRLAKMRPLRQVRPDIPEALEEIIVKALSRKVQDRFQKAGEMGEALAEFRLIYQTQHGRGRLDELMERLFAKEMAKIRQEQQAARKDRASRPPTPKQVPAASAKKRSRSQGAKKGPPPPPPPPQRQARRPQAQSGRTDIPKKERPTRPAPPPLEIELPNLPPKRPETLVRGASMAQLEWDEEEEATRAQPQGATTDELDWDEEELQTRAQPPPRFAAPPDIPEDARAGQARGREEKKPLAESGSARNLDELVPDDDFDDNDDDQDDPTLAVDAAAGLLHNFGVFVSESSEEQPSDIQDDPSQTVAEQDNPLLALYPSATFTDETEKTVRSRGLTAPHDTIELQTAIPSSPDGGDLDIDVDLSMMSPAARRASSALFLVRNSAGQTSGPFSRIQLHDDVLSGTITFVDRIAPTKGTGVPRPLDGSTWVSPGLYICDNDTEFEVQVALQLPPMTRTYNLEIEPVARIFLRMTAKRRHGVLIFDYEGVHKEITFSRGQPTYCSSNLPDEQLGSTLVQLGLTTQQGLSRALETGLAEQLTLPEAVTRLGLVSKDVLDNTLERLLRSRILELFHWGRGAATYHPGHVDAAPVDLYIEPLELLHKGVHATAGPNGPTGWLRDRESKTFILSGDSRRPLDLLGIPKRALDFLERFQTPMSVREVIEAVVSERLDDEEIAAAILVAVQTGYLATVAE